MVEQDALDLHRIDVVATADEHLFHPPSQPEDAVVVAGGESPVRSQPSTSVSAVPAGSFQIARHHGRRGEPEFADLAIGQRSAVLIADVGLDPGRGRPIECTPRRRRRRGRCRGRYRRSRSSCSESSTGRRRPDGPPQRAPGRGGSTGDDRLHVIEVVLGDVGQVEQEGDLRRDAGDGRHLVRVIRSRIGRARQRSRRCVVRPLASIHGNLVMKPTWAIATDERPWPPPPQAPPVSRSAIA